MRTDPATSRILSVLALASIVGCWTAGVSPGPSAAGGSDASEPAPGQSLGTGHAAASPVQAAAGRDAWLLVGKATEPGLHLIQATTGEAMLDLPTGAVATEDWGREIVATPAGATTTVRDLVVEAGLGGPQLAIDGAWRLPTIGYDPTPVGLSADGSTAALVEAGPIATAAGRKVSRFAILHVVPLEGPARIIELPGSFDYDAISPDGSILYVVEHLAGEPEGRYQVRAVDVATGVMREAIIADKSNIDEAMAGWPIAQVRRPDGLVMTLYRGPEHPFIHALNAAEAWAVCIDLPGVHAHDAKAALDWGLAAAPDGGAVFAVNATLGLVEDISPSDLLVRRSVAVQPLAGASIVLAKYLHGGSGPVGRRVVVAPDGRTIYAAGSAGILVIDTDQLAEVHRFLDGTSVAGLGLTPDGQTLVALDGGGRIQLLDAASGAIVGRVPADGFDRLLAVAPW
jgi:hypothetical protein